MLFKKTSLVVLFIIFISFHCDLQATNSNELNIYIYNIKKNIKEYKHLGILPNDSKNDQKIIDLLTDVRKRELQNSDRYQVITAQDSHFFAYQVIAKELYESLNSKQIHDFEFLRYPQRNLKNNFKDFFNQYPYLITQDAANRSTHNSLDNNPEISDQILSASLSMETNIFADSALFVFLMGKGIATSANSHTEENYRANFLKKIEELFEHAGVEKSKYKPLLKKLIEAAPRTQQGIVNQIFFNKENIEKYLYISLPLGFVDKTQNKDLRSFFLNFQKNRLLSNFNVKKNVQVRILAGTLFDGKVAIYRYSLIPEKEQMAYKKLVRETIKKIIK